VAQKGKDTLEKQFELMQTEIEELTEKLALVGNLFFKYQLAAQFTVQKVCRAGFWEIAQRIKKLEEKLQLVCEKFLKCQVATQFTIQKVYSADFWEILQRFKKLVEKLGLVCKKIFKCQLATQFTIKKGQGCSADFWEIPQRIKNLIELVIKKLSNVSLLLNLRYKRAIVLTFEKFPKQSRSL